MWFFLCFVCFFTASPSIISSGLKVQTWSPWSPHHHSLYSQAKTKSTIANASNMNLNNWTTTTQPIRRASMTSSRSADENYASRSAKKHFKRTNTFDTGLLSMSIKCSNDPRSNISNNCDTDRSSSSSCEKSGSFENVSTHSNPF